MTDIAPYLELIRYDGTLVPSSRTLYQLHLRHTHTIPFENLSPLTGEEVRLDIPSLLEKFTVRNRGGYCFEHNTVFQHVLQQLGFKTLNLAARVRLNEPDEVITPRSHMLLLVEADGQQWVADTGFGGMTLPVPIRFIVDEIQDTPHGQYRLGCDSRIYRLETQIKEEWKVLYMFDLAPHYPPDYEVYNWHVSRHPSSYFVTDLVAARAAKEGRHVLHDTQYSFYSLAGEVEKRQLHSVNEIKELLENTFRIRTDGVPKLDARLDALLTAGENSRL
tara:strand:- start:33892 stop:34719 length:828 start_codon:yes stop_codon:yes gene_type:complete